MAEIITRTVVELEDLGLFQELNKAYIDAGLEKKWESATFDETTRKISFYTVAQPSGDAAPAFEFTLPEVDFTEINSKITEVESNVNKNAEDIATNTSAIEAINNADTGILKTAQTYADTKVQELADGQVTTNASDITTMKGQIAALESGTYDDSELRGLIEDNTEAIEAHKTAIDGIVTTLVGEDTGKSVRTIANEELAAQLLSGEADADFQTLQELAAWLENHPDDVATINLNISNLQKLIGTLPTDATSSDVIGYIAEVVASEKTRAEGVESGLNTRLQAIESQLGDGEGSVDEKIATAKSEAISESNTYANELNTAMAGRVTIVETAIGEGGSVTTAIESAQADATSALDQIAAIKYATEDDIRALFQ